MYINDIHEVWISFHSEGGKWRWQLTSKISPHARAEDHIFDLNHGIIILIMQNIHSIFIFVFLFYAYLSDLGVKAHVVLVFQPVVH